MDANLLIRTVECCSVRSPGQLKKSLKVVNKPENTFVIRIVCSVNIAGESSIPSFSEIIYYKNLRKLIVKKYIVTNTHTHARARTHIHTHTHIYIYLYLFIKLQPPPATAGSARIMPRNEVQ